MRNTGHSDLSLFKDGHLSHASGPALLFLAIIFRWIYIEMKKLIGEKEELELARADEEDNLNYT